MNILLDFLIMRQLLELMFVVLIPFATNICIVTIVKQHLESLVLDQTYSAYAVTFFLCRAFPYQQNHNN